MTDAPHQWDTLVDHITEYVRGAMEEAFEVGWDAHYQEELHQMADPTHPITRVNPFKKQEMISLFGADGRPLSIEEVQQRIADYQREHPEGTR